MSDKKFADLMDTITNLGFFATCALICYWIGKASLIFILHIFN